MQSDPSIPKQEERDDEKSPIFGSWTRVYVVLIAVLISVIVGLYFFSKHFS